MVPAPDNASSSHASAARGNFPRHTGGGSSRNSSARWRTIWLLSTTGSAVAALSLVLVFGLGISRRVRLDAPRSTLILTDRNGAFLTQIGNAASSTAAGVPHLDYGYWPLEHLPERVVRATLALEDRRFWNHPGVDPIAVVRALWHHLHGGR